MAKNLDIFGVSVKRAEQEKTTVEKKQNPVTPFGDIEPKKKEE